MRAYIDEYGALWFQPEDQTEHYAVKQWMEYPEQRSQTWGIDCALIPAKPTILLAEKVAA